MIYYIIIQLLRDKFIIKTKLFFHDYTYKLRILLKMPGDIAHSSYHLFII